MELSAFAAAVIGPEAPLRSGERAALPGWSGRLLEAVDAAPHGLALLAAVRQGDDPVDLTWLWANAALERLVGRERVHLLGRGLREELGELRDSGLLDNLLRLCRRDGGGEAGHVFRAGRDRWLRVSAMVLRDWLLVAVNDVTDQRASRHALDEAAGAIEQGRRFRQQVLSAVSHDLRTPLNTIIGFAEIMKEGMFGPIAHPRYLDYVRDILQAGRNVLAVVDQFLDRSLLEEVSQEIGRGYSHLIELAPDMMCLVRNGRIVMMNAAGADMVGVWPAAELVGRRFADFVQADYRPVVEDGLAELMEERNRVPMKLVAGDDREIDVEIAAVACRAAGEEDAAMIVARDVSERNRSVKAMLEREERLRRIMEAVAEGILLVDEDGQLDSINPAGEEMFGCRAEERVGQPVARLIPEWSAYQAALLGDGVPRSGRGCQGSGRRSDGTAFPLDLALNPLLLGHKRLVIAVVHDITQRKAAEDHLRYLAHHDALTGLGNRALFQDRLAAEITRADHRGGQVAVLFVDLDNFKHVNDTMGHRFGDLTLQAVASRLRHCVGDDDLVARMGGDEFTIIVGGTDDRAGAAALAEMLRNRLLEPFDIDGKEIFLSASIGIAVYPADGIDILTLLKSVDMAAHHAKKQGGNAFYFFTEDLGAKAVERAAIEKGLRAALANDEFHLVYQPKIDLASGRVAGFEALLRWNSAELGAVPPAVFIPVAEETGLIQPIGAWVLRQACRQVGDWGAAGIETVAVAVNLSARQFRRPDLTEQVAAVLAETGIAARLLELELTESMLVEDAEEAIGIMTALKRLGVALSIDDFGTGYSSLAYLKRFPVDALKIDRSFVKDIPDDQDDMAITRAIIHMARSLDLRLVAEGIEKRAQLDFLHAQGCDEGQGFYFSKPVLACEVPELLTRFPRPAGE